MPFYKCQEISNGRKKYWYCKERNIKNARAFFSRLSKSPKWGKFNF